VKQLGADVPAADLDGSIGDGDFELFDMAPERTVVMMVLAVNIGGDHPSDRDEFGAWHHRGEPAPRHEKLENVSQQHTCLAGQQSGVGIETP
jgi:hypothetical protein